MPSTEPPRSLQVVLVDRQRRRKVPGRRLRRVLEGAAVALRVRGEVALVLTGDRAIRRLNARYRHADTPTDVLSFPGPCGDRHAPYARPRRRPEEDGCDAPDAPLGDIVISVETAARNAQALGRTVPQELDVLALHGFLHVLGYDHDTDDGTMDRLERRLRKRLL